MIPALTGIRGYAALWVCVLHYTWGWRGDGVFLAIAKSGGVGVEVFFVLSGFILTYVYAERFQIGGVGAGYMPFLRARFARVYPLHFVTLLAVVGLSLASLPILGANDTPYTFALNVMLLHAWGFTDTVSWNEPSWSISTEAFAYLLFPLFIGRLYRASNVALAVMLVASAIMVWRPPYGYLLAGLADRGWVQRSQFGDGGSLIFFFFMFCLGAVTYCVAFRLKRCIEATWVYDVAFLSGAAYLFYLCLKGGDVNLGAVAATAIVFGLYRNSGLSRLIVGNRGAVFLGEISYALYLSHTIAPAAFNAILYQFGVEYWWSLLPLYAQIIGAIVVASGVHFGFERPAQTYILSLKSRSLGPVGLNVLR